MARFLNETGKTTSHINSLTLFGFSQDNYMYVPFIKVGVAREVQSKTTLYHSLGKRARDIALLFMRIITIT